MKLQRTLLKWTCSFGAIAFLVVLLGAFWRWPALAQTPAYQPPGGPRLRGMLVGSLVGWHSVYDPQQTDILKTEFNLLSSENNLKWDCLHHDKGAYNFARDVEGYCSPADKDVEFAETNHMAMHGHVLVWHQQLPAWVTDVTQTPVNQRLNVLFDHIDHVVGHYRGRVQIWDVVNEAIDCEGKPCRYRDTVWYQATNGPAYIVEAFKHAHMADPNAILLYNDFWLGEGNPKSTFLLTEIPKWQTAGAPINAVGFQMHIDTSFNQFQAFSNDLQRFAKLGLDVYITELDVAVNANASIRHQQADVYKELLKRCLAQANCKGFQTWGLTDRYSWRGVASHPLLFDENFRPKAAYYALQDGLRSTTLQAEAYTAQSGVATYDTFIGYVDNGDWLRFDNVDFGNGYTSLTTRYAKGNTSKTWVEVRLGSLTGTKIAQFNSANTGGWNTFKEQSISLVGPTGRQTLYFVFRGGDGVGNFDWFRFSGSVSPTLEAEDSNSRSGVTAYPLAFIAYVQNGGWVKFNNVNLLNGYTTLRVRYAKGVDSDAWVEVHLGSLTGLKIAELHTTNTGSWDTYTDATTTVTSGIGKQTLYFVFKGNGVGNFDWFRLESGTVSAAVNAASITAWSATVKGDSSVNAQGDGTANDQSYLDDSTTEDLPTAPEQTDQADNQIFLPLVVR